MDFLNGSTGSLIDQFLVGAGFLAFLLTFSVTPIWFAAVLGLLIGLGAPVLLHFKCPGLYMTAEEKNDAFERTRRFGRNR
ncbi:MAG: hypothetical protein CMK09_04040 [Ponticaulis sp.]|nr:hypothetical protein [Ponticaulis sp.]|tara:strand:- start:9594 stop:9833 length:240 start_codon:yes stop_codon:yes gene_type:complete